MILVVLFAYIYACSVPVEAWFWPGSGEANIHSTVISCKKTARFTILTDSLIRMEYSKDGAFRNEQTFAIINRNLPVPSYTVTGGKAADDMLTICTSHITLNYKCGSGSFDQENINVQVVAGDEKFTWKGESDNAGNLLGTVRTLDKVNGSLNLDCDTNSRADLHCAYGIVSRAGFVVIDDTQGAVFSPGLGQVRGEKTSSWPWYVAPGISANPVQCTNNDSKNRNCGSPASTTESTCIAYGCCWSHADARCFYGDSYQDLYFLGHGHNYRQALKEFSLISGSIPMPPRYALGIWYSRYWAYSDAGQMDIVSQYVNDRLPLDVLVTDMDWHSTYYKEVAQHMVDPAGERYGWTGFTWDKNLFPNPHAFLQWCKRHNLKNTLNLHPASGIQRWEERFDEVASYMGINTTAVKAYVPFNATDPKFMDAWLHMVLGKLATQGIDVWWLDWQQGEAAEQYGVDGFFVNPTFWLNYVFFTDPGMWDADHNGTSAGLRPMILHRWGGLGNHRMPLGFSGDTIPSWESLKYQTYFTATASNVLYGHWSHDIGGHVYASPPELFTRWVQFGVLSPVFRSHCTKNGDNDRRVWMYPPRNFNIMREAMRFRARINPYLYTASRASFDTAVSMVHPLYYDWPEYEEAYDFKYQYLLGDDMLAAPITSPMDDVTELASKVVWFPPGRWVGFESALEVVGPIVLHGEYTLNETPLFVREGSIIPMRLDSEAIGLGAAEKVPQGLAWRAFVCSAQSGRGRVYDDDGKTTAYEGQAGGFAFTNATFQVTDNLISFVVGPMVGDFQGKPVQRPYQVQFVGVYPAATVSVVSGVGPSQEVPYVPWFLTSQATGMGAGALPVASDAWTYDGDKLSLFVFLTPRSTAQSITVLVNSTRPGDIAPSLCTGIPALLARLFEARDLLDLQWGSAKVVYQQDYPHLLTAAQAGKRMSYDPALVIAEITQFNVSVTAALGEVRGLVVDSSVRARLLKQLFGVVETPLPEPSPTAPMAGPTHVPVALTVIIVVGIVLALVAGGVLALQCIRRGQAKALTQSEYKSMRS